MGAKSKSAAVDYLQRGVGNSRPRAGCDRRLACADSSAAPLVLGGFVRKVGSPIEESTFLTFGVAELVALAQHAY